MRQRAEKYGIEFELDLGDNLLLLRVDERKLKQILVKLICSPTR